MEGKESPVTVGEAGEAQALNTPPDVDHSQTTKDGTINKKETTGIAKTTEKGRQKSVANDRPYSCDVCGKRFEKNTHLDDHLRVHSGEKPFVCEVCKKPFTQKGGLNVHYRIHNGIKPFSCPTCGDRFRTLSTLKNHRLTHTGEKSFQCTECGRSFGRSSSLARHRHTHKKAKTVREVLGVHAKLNQWGTWTRHMIFSNGESSRMTDVVDHG